LAIPQEVAVLEHIRTFSSYSIDDLDAARAFYQGKLGMELKENEMGFLELTVGGGQFINLYTKPNHQPATYTVLNFVVKDIEKAVDDLVASGVKMEQYGIPEMNQDAKGIARDERGPAIAWFNDPAGNTLAVLEVPQR
jgi:catechol 2,3-dioxygenase-like lactoylglutathione lyase family enzyme